MIDEWLDSNAVYRYEWKEGLSIFYSPIARCYAVATDAQLETFLNEGHYAEVFVPLTDYVPISLQKKVVVPSDYTLLTVLPNNVCNFACSYCYSAAGRNGAWLKEEHLEGAIDFFIGSKPDGFSRTLTISYMGGGEPMLAWQIVKDGICYAEKQAAKRHLRLHYRVITNGSLVDDEMLTFLKEHAVDVSVSFEILRDIQDLQRKHYDSVDRNIRRLIDKGVSLQINATITLANASRMEEMLDKLLTDYPQVKNVMFEPVTGQQMFATPNEMAHFYHLYTKQFTWCLRKAYRHAVSLTSFAYLRTVFPLERACPGELCLTADGQFSGCYCVSSPREPLFGQTRYGWVDDDGSAHFDMVRYNELKAHDVYERSECQHCRVKWNCGGGCFYQYATYSEPYRQVVCDFTRHFVEQMIRYKVEQRLNVDSCFPILLKE